MFNGLYVASVMVRVNPPLYTVWELSLVRTIRTYLYSAQTV